MDYCVPRQCYGSPNPDCDGIWRWGLREEIRLSRVWKGRPGLVPLDEGILGLAPPDTGRR